jgi:hypothetical protein
MTSHARSAEKFSCVRDRRFNFHHRLRRIGTGGNGGNGERKPAEAILRLVRLVGAAIHEVRHARPFLRDVSANYLFPLCLLFSALPTGAAIDATHGGDFPSSCGVRMADN